MGPSRGARRTALAAGTLVLLSAAAPGGERGEASGDRPPGGHAYLDGPPPGHTGGFGEPTCVRCHFDAAVDPPEARLEIRGIPEAFVPDSAYRLTLRLTAPELGRAGFELAIRCRREEDGGRQAGRLSAPDARAEVVKGEGEEFRGDPTVLYARHTRQGSRPTAGDTATWALAWTAPDGCPSAVLHAAANAANGDDSEFGDRILTGTWTARRRGSGRPAWPKPSPRFR